MTLIIDLNLPEFLGGKTLWEGVGNVLKRKLRPIFMNLIVSNDGLRLIQMHQLKKRDFVATDHVSYCLKSSVNVLFVVFFFICINLFVEQESCKWSFMLCKNYFGNSKRQKLKWLEVFVKMLELKNHQWESKKGRNTWIIFEICVEFNLSSSLRHWRISFSCAPRELSLKKDEKRQLEKTYRCSPAQRFRIFENSTIESPF